MKHTFCPYILANKALSIFNKSTRYIKIFILIFFMSSSIFNLSGQNNKNSEILNTMKSASRYMMDVVSYKGGFVWNYLPDFSRTWGEMEAKRTMVWIQPPGTPAVGHLMIDAYHATNDEYYYECAKRIANTLIWGQLPCGGWNYMFDFDGEQSMKDWYSKIGKNGWRLEEFQHYYGNATFDDAGTIQAAKFLLRLYLEKYDPTYRESLDKVIDLVLKSQYSIGGWPQRYPLMNNHPFLGKSDYTSFITLNDGVISENIDFLLQCYSALGLSNLKEPIMRAMNLMLLLQQGQPYAGWSDQYNVDDLNPAHGRSYEPRSINTGTTARMIGVMIDLFKLTGETKFLSGIPSAINFIESQKLSEPDLSKWGHSLKDKNIILVPRFVDPESGKPLYVHRKGSNVKNGFYYTDQNIENTIAHYSSAIFINVETLKKAYQNALSIPQEEIANNTFFKNNKSVEVDRYYFKPYTKAQAESVEKIIKEFHKEGYWLSQLKQISNPYKENSDNVDIKSDETKYATTMVGDEFDTSPYSSEKPVMGISTATFINNMTTLIYSIK